ncbi:MAG: phage antirepressor N-terminal domain-containing protein [Pelotomaculum sp.]|nr:phage antirepressor N-terminal domain-containing protein [Pelotomaculum sp.]
MSETKDMQVLTVQKVRFYDDELMAAVVEKDGKQEIYVAVKPICEKFGLSWPRQFRKIKGHSVFSEGIALMATPSEGGQQTALCLNLDYLPAYLMTIHPTKVCSELRDKLVIYQKEAARVLRDYFVGPGYAINPARVDLARLETETERLKIERIKAQAELERIQAEREKNMRLLAFVEKYPLPADFQKAVISRLAGLEVQPAAKYYATEQLAGQFTFEFGTRITGKRISMLATEHGIRIDDKAGERENEFSFMSVTPAVNRKTGRAIEGKVVEQVLYKEAAVPVLRSLVRQWLETRPVKPKKPRKQAPAS